MFWWGLVIGLFIGATIGVMAISLCFATRED